MLLGGPDNSCTGLIKPALYLGQGLLKGQRVFEHPWIGSDTNEGGQHRPAQANGLTAGKLTIPPLTRLLVKR